jgi:hypothetical protein
MNLTNQTRTVYKLVTEGERKIIEQHEIRIGIADTQNTELLAGGSLAVGDELITFVTMPGAATAVTTQPQNANPFNTNQGRGGGGGGRGGGRGF